MKRALRFAVIAVLALSACTQEPPRFEDLVKVGDTVNGQIVFQVNDDGSFLTAPDVPCIHEDGSGQDLPCVWRADRRGNFRGDSVIIMPGIDGEPEFIRFE